MPDRHPDEDMLLDLALGDVAEPDDEELIGHLAECPDCRDRFDDLSKTIDQTLAAAPRVHPPPGFDQRVLTAMGMSESAGPEPSPGSPDHRVRRFSARRVTLVAIAACLAGLAIGFGGSLAVDRLADDVPVVSSGVPLLTADGSAVGTAAFSYFEERRVIVVTVGDGGDAEYECRLRFTDGSTEILGQWRVPDSGATWIMPVPYRDAAAVELVNAAGVVWSSATL